MNTITHNVIHTNSTDPLQSEHSNKQTKLYYGLLDYFKLFAAILVITIHTFPLASINTTANFILTSIFARIGVPFFFMVTGFFLLPKCFSTTFSAKENENSSTGFFFSLSSKHTIVTQKKDSFSSLLRFLKKTCILYGLTILLYLPINFYNGYFQQESLPNRLIKDIIFDGTFYHLWYLPALILGVLIVFLLLKTKKLFFTMITTTLLYIIGFVGDSYFGLLKSFPFLQNLYFKSFHISSYTRNGIFFAPIFLLIGYLIACNVIKHTYSFQKYIRLFGISFALLLVEGLLLNYFHLQRHSSMYVMLPFVMYFLFQILIFESKHYSIPGNTEIRKTSMLIYVFHPLFIILIRGFAKLTNLTTLLVTNQFIHFIAVTVSTTIFSYFIACFWLDKKKKTKNYI